jgi:hypothetical protein
VSTSLQLAAVLSPAFIVWLVLHRRVPGRGVAFTLELAGTAAAIALGVTSITFFIWRLIGLHTPAYLAFDIGAQVLVAGTMVYRRERPTDGMPACTALEPRRLRILGGTIAAGAIVIGAMLLAHTLVALPYGWWDGWSIWNLRAAFLSVPDDHWRDGFTSTLAWSHPDYPLLVPASVARLWQAGEPTSAFAPRLFAVAVVASSAMVLAGSVARHAGVIAMSLALSLLLIPSYVYWGASQTADVPLGLYVLVAVAALAGSRTERRYLIAGLAAGLAAWTKNEGVLVAAVLAGIVAVMVYRSGGGVRPLSRFGVGLSAGVLALLLFTSAVAPPSDLLQQMLTQQPLAKAADIDRHIFVARYMLGESLTWGNWLFVPPSVLLAGCVVIAGFRWREVPGQVGIGVAMVGVMLAGYYWVYVLSPYDLQWHLDTSWPRLIAQVWPTIVWAAVIAAFSSRKPSEASRDTPPSGRSSPPLPFRWRSAVSTRRRRWHS